jgi:hypothetical protein
MCVVAYHKFQIFRMRFTVFTEFKVLMSYDILSVKYDLTIRKKILLPPSGQKCPGDWGRSFQKLPGSDTGLQGVMTQNTTICTTLHDAHNLFWISPGRPSTLFQYYRQTYKNRVLTTSYPWSKSIPTGRKPEYVKTWGNALLLVLRVPLL